MSFIEGWPILGRVSFMEGGERGRLPPLGYFVPPLEVVGVRIQNDFPVYG